MKRWICVCLRYIYAMAESRRNVRVRRLYEQGEEMDLERTMPSERISMMWQLALDAYAFKREHLLNPDFRDILFAFAEENVEICF